MANFEVPENPEFTEGIRKLETTDRGHANIFNAVFEPIINNVLYVKKMLTEHMMAKNPHGIKPADLGLENVENKPMGELSTEFTVAETRSNIQSKQDMKTILGMLAKWYLDLKKVAWSGNYEDLNGKPTIPSGAAASYGVANNDTTSEPGFLADARIVRQHGIEIDEINRDLGGYQFDTIDGVPSYKAGADTAWVPFKKEPVIGSASFSWLSSPSQIFPAKTGYKIVGLYADITAMNVSAGIGANINFGISKNLAAGRISITGQTGVNIMGKFYCVYA